MPAGKYLTETQESDIVKMARAGYSATRIAERFGIARQTVGKVTRRHGVKGSQGRKINFIYGQ